MILPDVNVLVHAFKRESVDHERYRAWLQSTLGGAEDVAVVDLVLLGVVRITTHPRIFRTPAPLTDALQFVDAIRRSDVARPVASSEATWAEMGALASADRLLRGNLVPDAFLAAVARTTGARIATADAGFARFPGTVWFDPVSSA